MQFMLWHHSCQVKLLGASRNMGFTHFLGFGSDSYSWVPEMLMAEAGECKRSLTYISKLLSNTNCNTK